MKHQAIRPEGINQVADSITRSNSESEDIDLGAEATDSAPSKSLAPAAKPGRVRRQRAAVIPRSKKPRP